VIWSLCCTTAELDGVFSYMFFKGTARVAG
jgi:hypothetical protein